MKEFAGERFSAETEIREFEALGDKVTLRVGGRARYYAEPANLEDLRRLLRLAPELGVEPFFLGRGSNLLVLDGELPFLVIRFRHENWRKLEVLEGDRLAVGAGLRMRELCNRASRLGMRGFEFLEGIPGTVGGGLRMNAGAMGGTFYDLVEKVHLLSRDGRDEWIGRDQLAVGYRHCAEVVEKCALGAVLRVRERGETAEIVDRIREFQKRRTSTQPKEASAGCMFKNPEGDSAGRLIDQLGLKGRGVGGAEVSGIHGNFVINGGGATSEDVIGLMREVRGEVFRRTGIELQPEVQLLGGKWEDFL